jgi:hypothetical protein
MAVEYQVYYRLPWGDLPSRAPLEFSSLDYARAENDVGSLTMTIAASRYPVGYFVEDGILEVWRSVNGLAPTIDMFAVWFIRRIRIYMTDAGENLLELTAYDPNHLLRRRIIAYANGSTYSDKNSYADNVIKALVRENLGALVFDATRNLSSYITVDADTTLGAIEIKETGWSDLLSTMQDFANASLTDGIRLVFDMMYDGPMKFRFSTWKNYRGTDRSYGSTLPMVVSVENGNLASPELILDYSSEVNYVYATGQGQNSFVIEKETSDAARIGKSPFNRCEGRMNARYANSDDGVLNEAKTALAAARPRAFFNGRILQTPTNLYGIHYFYGDQVAVNYSGYSFAARVAVVHVTVDGSGEQLDMRLSGDFAL